MRHAAIACRWHALRSRAARRAKRGCMPEADPALRPLGPHRSVQPWRGPDQTARAGPRSDRRTWALPWTALHLVCRRGGVPLPPERSRLKPVSRAHAAPQAGAQVPRMGWQTPDPHNQIDDLAPGVLSKIMRLPCATSLLWDAPQPSRHALFDAQQIFTTCRLRQSGPRTKRILASAGLFAGPPTPSWDEDTVCETWRDRVLFSAASRALPGSARCRDVAHPGGGAPTATTEVMLRLGELISTDLIYPMRTPLRRFRCSLGRMRDKMRRL